MSMKTFILDTGEHGQVLPKGEAFEIAMGTDSGRVDKRHKHITE